MEAEHHTKSRGQIRILAKDTFSNSEKAKKKKKKEKRKLLRTLTVTIISCSFFSNVP